MALELNGTTGVSLVQDGVVTAADLASTLDLTGKTVTLPAGTGGKVLQVVNAIKTDVFSTTSSSFVDVTGLSLSITPSSTSSKILLFSQVGYGNTSDSDEVNIGLYRDSTELETVKGWLDTSGAQYFYGNTVLNYLDSPSSTSSLIYKIRASRVAGTAYINTRHWSAGTALGYSTITAMEIAA